MLETNDGNLHLEQAIEVLKAGKPMFIDKPVAADLVDAIAIFKLADQYNVRFSLLQLCVLSLKTWI